MAQGREAVDGKANVVNPKDNEVAGLDQKRQDRGYNPVDDAPRGTVSSELNTDSARYRKGPGPV